MSQRLGSLNRFRRWDGFVIALAVAILVVAMVYWRTVSAYRAPYRILTDLPIPGWIEQLYAWRWVVRGAMLAAGAGLTAVELLGQSVTRRLKVVLSQPLGVAVLIASMTLIGRGYLLTPGRLALADGLLNVAYVLAHRVALEQGNVPPFFWSNYAWMGFPWNQFHNSIFYYEGALVDLVVRDAFLTTKVALLAHHVLAALTMFFYVRYLTRSSWAGLVSATVWATSFFHYQFFVHIGAIHLSLFIAIMPAALLCVEVLLDGRRRRLAMAGLALTVSLLLWVQPYYAAITVALMMLYSLTRLMLNKARRMSLGERGVRLGLILAGTTLGALGAISQWLPPFVERNLVIGWNPGTRFPNSAIDWRQVLSFRGSFLTPEMWGGYVGLSVFGLAMVGVALGLANRDRRMSGLVVWLAVTAYLSLGPRYLPFDVVFQRIPFGEFVYAIRTPGKYLLYAEFSLAVLTGVALREIGLGLYRLRRRAGSQGWRLAVIGRRLALLMVAAIAGEMVFLTLQVNSLYPESWVGVDPGHKEALEWLRANGDRTSRVLDMAYSNMEVAALTGQPTFASVNEEAPPATGLFFWLYDSAIREDLSAGQMRRATRDALYVLDVGYVVLEEPAPGDSDWRLGYRGEPFKVWQVEEHSPVVAALSLKPVSSSGSPSRRELIEMMGIDRTTNVAALIPVSAMPAAAGGEAVKAEDQTPLRLEVKGYRVGLTSVVIDFAVSRPAYLQLGYSAYPYLYAYLDGARREYFSTAFDLVGLATPAGEHHLELRPSLSPIRVTCFWLDLIGLLAIIGLMAWARVNRGHGT